MNIRPLYDRIVVKRIEDKRRSRVVCISQTRPKKSRKRAKSSPWARASAWKMAKWLRST